MTTFNELVEQVQAQLHAFTTQEQLTWLTAPVTDSATSLSVNDGNQVSRGLVEIDDELMYVASVATNTVTLAPFGRGFRGTTAAAHSSGAKVTFDPHFPRVDIKRAINETLAAVYPRLYQIKDTTFTFAGSQATYELPADADGVVNVTFELSGPSGYWMPITSWQFHRDSEEVTGRAITLLSAPEQGSTVKVTYRAAFAALVNDADTLASVGFPDSAGDVLKFGAAYRLVQFLDVSRLQMSAAENYAHATDRKPGDPSKLANQFYAMYMQRLEEERKKLLELEPPQIHYTR